MLQNNFVQKLFVTLFVIELYTINDMDRWRILLFLCLISAHIAGLAFGKDSIETGVAIRNFPIHDFSQMSGQLTLRHANMRVTYLQKSSVFFLLGTVPSIDYLSFHFDQKTANTLWQTYFGLTLFKENTRSNSGFSIDCGFFAKSILMDWLDLTLTPLELRLYSNGLQGKIQLEAQIPVADFGYFRPQLSCHYLNSYSGDSPVNFSSVAIHAGIYF